MPECSNIENLIKDCRARARALKRQALVKAIESNDKSQIVSYCYARALSKDMCAELDDLVLYGTSISRMTEERVKQIVKLTLWWVNRLERLKWNGNR